MKPTIDLLVCLWFKTSTYVDDSVDHYLLRVTALCYHMDISIELH